MKKSFVCSLICHNGIIGGGICLEDSAISYRTNKLTVDKRYKNLVLPLNEVCELSWKWIVFPIATLRMASGEWYKFIIFNKKRFNKYYTELKR
ncbi:MAG: hypothetical protein E7348_01590 [Clostridiales bacterium]|nr:hypothetical protein [Clostridiales bacterium]